MSWRETGREARNRDSIFVLWKCGWCGKKAVTVGSDKPTACCCNSKPRDGGAALGPDPSGKWRPWP